jgi:uncharacterized membrane protein HdeD (DUF308 family)
VADLFMLVMASRPGSGSLSRTWVTPATLQMSVVLVAACLLAGGLAAFGVVHASIVVIALLTGLVLLALGAAAVALVGLAQRRT